MTGTRDGIRIDIDDREVQAALRRLREKVGDLSDTFRDIGEHLLNATQARFDREIDPAGNPWTPLKPKTKASKRRKGYRDKIMQMRGHLRDHLVMQADPDGVEIGTNRIYGATHQFGDASRGIPARPFLGISEDDTQYILDVLAEDLERVLNGK